MKRANVFLKTCFEQEFAVETSASWIEFYKINIKSRRIQTNFRTRPCVCDDNVQRNKITDKTLTAFEREFWRGNGDNAYIYEYVCIAEICRYASIIITRQVFRMVANNFSTYKNCLVSHINHSNHILRQFAQNLVRYARSYISKLRVEVSQTFFFFSLSLSRNKKTNAGV